MEPNHEPISLLVCTRNRPEDMAVVFPAMLAQEYPNYEIVLIDQSDNDETAQLVAPYAERDSRIRYIPTETRGLSIARNLALTAARSEICAFTDDDCLVTPQWLGNIRETFAKFPETHILFSPVHVPPEMGNREDLRFPSFYFSEARTLDKGEIFGMGANMTLRKSFWELVAPSTRCWAPELHYPVPTNTTGFIGRTA